MDFKEENSSFGDKQRFKKQKQKQKQKQKKKEKISINSFYSVKKSNYQICKFN